jgi:hypothetical protein
MQINKYEITGDNGYFDLNLRTGFKILSVQTQYPSKNNIRHGINCTSRVYMWILEYQLASYTKVSFRVIHTGEAFDDKYLEYVATYQDDGFVGHLFLVKDN